MVIAEPGDGPNLEARGLKSGRLGVIVPHLRNPYFDGLADAVMRAASATKLAVHSFIASRPCRLKHLAFVICEITRRTPTISAR